MKSLRPLEAIGAVLTIMGSFLPWEYSGGCFGSNITGIRVYLDSVKYWIRGIHTFPVNDYGGVLIILLTLLIIFLSLRRTQFIRKPILWKLVVSAVLSASSLFFVGRGLVHTYATRNLTEPCTLMFGLLFVTLGSVILLWETIKAYHETIRKDVNTA